MHVISFSNGSGAYNEWLEHELKIRTAQDKIRFPTNKWCYKHIWPNTRRSFTFDWSHMYTSSYGAFLRRHEFLRKSPYFVCLQEKRTRLGFIKHIDWGKNLFDYKHIEAYKRAASYHKIWVAGFQRWCYRERLSSQQRRDMS